MSLAEQLTPADGAETTKQLKLAFLNNVPFTESAPGGSAQGLREALELFTIAEELGYDTGWVRDRHFDNYLSSPLTLLAVAAERTSRIKLGTAVITVGYEEPIRLAEDAVTVDLLSDNRLQLGIGRGIPLFGPIFGNNDGAEAWQEVARERVDRLVSAIEGTVLGTSPGGADYYVRPHSPTLRDRIWYGPASVSSAALAGEQGLDLLMSAVAPDIGLSFDEAQREKIRAHRAAWTRTDRPPRISAARTFFPALNDRQRKLYRGYGELRAREGFSASRPQGALPPDSTFPMPAGYKPPGMLMSPVEVGEPAEIVDYLQNDVAIAEADELMIFLPPGFEHRESIEILENIAEHVAPELGWRPAR
jgi:alkanesulfonate monooxygenase SsuD/methylene tetrahydromethanopterin reductase-like flavin-dependent oxidoreductase (luciferase family)